jgi:hypothetical protein
MLHYHCEHLFCTLHLSLTTILSLIMQSDAILGTRKKDEDALYETADRDDDDDTGDLTPHEKILQGRKRLPIYAYREEFLEAVRDNKIIVVVGETGSGTGGEDFNILHFEILTIFTFIYFNFSFCTLFSLLDFSQIYSSLFNSSLLCSLSSTHYSILEVILTVSLLPAITL